MSYQPFLIAKPFVGLHSDSNHSPIGNLYFLPINKELREPSFINLTNL